MPTPQQLLAQAGRKPQDLSRANAATGTIQGANGGTQQLGPSALRRMQQQPAGQTPPIMAPFDPSRPEPVPFGHKPDGGDPTTEMRSMTGGGLQPETSVDVAGISPGAGVGGGFNLSGFKPVGPPLGIRPLPTTTNFDIGRQDPATAARPQPGAALGGVMPTSPGKLPSPAGNPAAGWSVGGPPAPGGGPDVRPPGLPGFKPAGGMLSKPVAPGLPGGDPPLSPDGFGGGKPRQLPYRRNGVTDVGRNSMAGF